MLLLGHQQNSKGCFEVSEVESSWEAQPELQAMALPWPDDVAAIEPSRHSSFWCKTSSIQFCFTSLLIQILQEVQKAVAIDESIVSELKDEEQVDSEGSDVA